MRFVLVGSAAERERLRADLGDSSIEVVGEFPTLAAARASGIEADGIILANRARASLAAGPEPAAEPLTPREIEVLELLAEGLSNKGIAGRLGISDQTVKFHVASIMGKLGAGNRTDAVRRAVRRGLLSL